MPQLTPQQIELIEKIKQGTHCIEMPDNPTQEDVKIFRKIRDEYFQNDCSIIENIGKFYNIVSRQKEDAERFAFWKFPIRDPYFNDMIPIPLSSFSHPQPKVVEVDDRRINKAIAYINGGLDSIELNDIDEIYGKSQVLDMLNDLKNILQPK